MSGGPPITNAPIHWIDGVGGKALSEGLEQLPSKRLLIVVIERGKPGKLTEVRHATLTLGAVESSLQRNEPRELISQRPEEIESSLGK